MQEAEVVLSMLGQKSIENSAFVFDRLYRNLLHPDFYLLAYSNIYAKEENMTQRVDESTIDGFNKTRTEEMISSLRQETYYPKQVRRTYIPKKNGVQRPLGISAFRDKLMQEVVRLLLQAMYEPLFRGKMRTRNGWRAGYAEMCTSGSEGGSHKPAAAMQQGGEFLPYKTTTTINVAVAASLLGKRVLVIDTDLQGNATTALGYEPSALEDTTYTLMLGKSQFEEVLLHTCFDKNTKRFVDPTDEGLLQNRRIKSENLVAGPDLLPCNVSAAQAENDLIRNPAWGSLLRNALQPIRSQYDYIFIDTHPDLGKMTVNSFIAADSVVIPVVPEPWPTDGLLVLSASIADAQAVNPNLDVSGILFTRVRYAEHTKLMEYVRDTLVEKINTAFPRLELSCFNTSVNESASFISSTSRRSCVVLSHPTDAVAISYWAFFAELLQREQNDDFAAAYEQFQQLLGVYKARELEKAESKQKVH